MYKIGYILDKPQEDIINDSSLFKRLKFEITIFFNKLKDVNNKFNLGLDLVLIDNYIEEECDLIIYNAFTVDVKKMYWHTYFNNAKGNPKWLFFDIGEPHNFGMAEFSRVGVNEYGMNWGDDRVLRPLCNFKHPTKGYSITTYETTPKNFMFPSFLKWGLYENLQRQLNDGTIERNRTIKKNYFCSMLLSDTTPERVKFFDYITKNYKSIRSYGRCKKNICNVLFDDEAANTIMPVHKFNICFENTHSDYNECYVTEKIFNAFRWGSIPIYWGENNYINKFLNKKAFINLTDKTLEESLEIIKEYDNNDKLYFDMLNEIPINTSYNINKIYDDEIKFIKKVLTE